METYENAVAGFKTSLPEEWVVAEDLLGAAVVFLEPKPDPDSFRASIAIAAQEADDSVNLEDFVDQELGQMGRFLTDFEITDRSERPRNGKVTLEVRSRYRQGIFHVALTQWIFASSGRVYTITCTSPTEDADRVLEVAEAIYGAFEVEPGPLPPPTSGPS